jgi:hypothetical protein
MASPTKDEDDDRPLDPAVERVRQRLVRFVAINLGLLFLALMAVVVAIVYRANRLPEPPPEEVTELASPGDGTVLQGRIALPPGATVLGHTVSGARLSVLIDLRDGNFQVVVYDMAQDRVIGQFDIAQGE